MTQRAASLRQPGPTLTRPVTFGRAARWTSALLLAAFHPGALPATDAESSDEHAWRLFVAVNGPLNPATGQADPKQRFGRGDSVAWEGWANARALFLGDGRDPGPWPAASRPDRASPDQRFDGYPPAPATPVRHVVGGRMVTLAPSPAAPLRLNETRINPDSFDYIRQRGLYSVEGQLSALGPRPAVDFPVGSRHVKAQWQPIAAHLRSRYFSKEVLLPDGRRQLYGLTALHIATKERPRWFWATFEHVDNAGGPTQPAWAQKSADRYACAGRAPDCNGVPRGIGLEGTVWRYYRLRGTMTDFVDAAGAPAKLANSRLESKLRPGTSSCITCHARATIGLVQGQVRRLPIFDGADDGPLPPGRDAEKLRSGFVGRPHPQWYEPSGSDPPTRYATLDFVWFLERAQRQPAPAEGIAMFNPTGHAGRDLPQRPDRP
jgi:hypothetical protein